METRKTLTLGDKHRQVFLEAFSRAYNADQAMMKYLSDTWEDELRRFMEQTSIVAFEVIESGQVLALAIVEKTSPTSLYIRQNACSPNSQRKGASTALMEEIKQRFPDRRLWLVVRRSNIAAQKFYLSLGFTVDENIRHDEYSPEVFVAMIKRP